MNKNSTISWDGEIESIKRKELLKAIGLKSNNCKKEIYL